MRQAHPINDERKTPHAAGVSVSMRHTALASECVCHVNEGAHHTVFTLTATVLSPPVEASGAFFWIQQRMASGCLALTARVTLERKATCSHLFKNSTFGCFGLYFPSTNPPNLN